MGTYEGMHMKACCMPCRSSPGCARVVCASHCCGDFRHSRSHDQGPRGLESEAMHKTFLRRDLPGLWLDVCPRRYSLGSRGSSSLRSRKRLVLRSNAHLLCAGARSIRDDAHLQEIAANNDVGLCIPLRIPFSRFQSAQQRPYPGKVEPLVP